MDHTDIRGLVTALHRSVAGLPRSRVGDHHGRCPHSSSEGSPHRVRASRCRSGVSELTSWPCSSFERVSGSRTWCHVPTDIPDEGGELPGECNTDLVVLKASSLQTPVAVVQAQLCAPGDGADLRGLSLLTQLQGSADAGREAVIPGRLDQDAPHVSIAGLGDRPKPALRTARVLGGNQSQIAHQFAWMRKAPEVSELGNNGGGGDEVQPAQRHHGAHEGVHTPVLDLACEGLTQSLYP